MSKLSRESFDRAAAEAAHRRALKNLEEITDEENETITKAAMADPDNPPSEELLRRRGRPPSVSSKLAIKLRIDPDVVEQFKAGGAGWQSRMNEALRKAAGLQPKS